MSKQNNNTPRLRFPEFTGEWVEKKLGEIGSFKKGQAFSKDEITSIGDTFCIHYGELFTKYQEIITEVISKTNSQMRVHSECGDILFPASDVTPTGLARCSAILKDNVLLGGDIIILRPEIPLISEFLSYTINTQKESIIRLVTGAVVKHITPGALASLTVFLPPTLAEQQKIAECLMAIDGQISAQSQKVEALKEKKKGMMQQLFPQKGETTPRLRFPEFTGEWEEKRLKEIFVLRNGYTPLKGEDSYWTDGEIPWFRMEDIREKGNVLYDSTQHITQKAIKGKGCFNANTIILATSATIGEHALIKVAHLANQRFVNLEINPMYSREISIEYAYYYMYIIDEICKSIGNIGTFASVSTEALSNLLFVYPPTLAEQQKIADCLSELDDLIASETKQLEALKDYKKGLMQQLFPQPAK